MAIVTALVNTVIGMGTVFIVLIFISFIISLFKYIPVIQEKFSKKNAASVPQPKASAPVPVVEEEEEELVDDAELVAVITAAIMASRQTVNATSADKLIVRSIRRAKKRV